LYILTALYVYTDVIACTSTNEFGRIRTNPQQQKCYVFSGTLNPTHFTSPRYELVYTSTNGKYRKQNVLDRHDICIRISVITQFVRMHSYQCVRIHS